MHGGFQKRATILLAGSSGSGKTIFALQWLFDGVKQKENGLYITLTEPLFKTIKNLEKLDFYKRSYLESERIKIVDLREVYTKEGFYEKDVIKFIVDQVKSTNAKRLCIDSITAIAYGLNDKSKIRNFIFDLGKVLASLGCTTLLTSEIREGNEFSAYGVEEFISDTIIKFERLRERTGIERRIRIIKVRGNDYETGEVFFTITSKGILVFPSRKSKLNYLSHHRKISTGNEELDKLFHGGILVGSSTMIAGATGSGKSILSIQFLLHHLKKGKKCLYVSFEESEEQILRNSKSLGWDLKKYIRRGLLTINCAYPHEKNLNEHLQNIRKLIKKNKIKRFVIDSLSAIENSFDSIKFVNFTKDLNAYLKSKGITTFLISATSTLIGGNSLTNANLSTTADNILMLRYVEIQGTLKQVLNIVKVRGSSHDKGLMSYKILKHQGITIGNSFSGYEGILTGSTRKVSDSVEDQIKTEFKIAIGPMADQVLNELRSKGINKKNIISYLEELEREGIMTENALKTFKKRIYGILKVPYSEEDLILPDKPTKKFNFLSKVIKKVLE